MSIKTLNVLSKKGAIHLPEWIKFAFEIGSYMNDYGIINRKPIRLIISLPSDQFFALFIAMGISDKSFSISKRMKSIKNRIIGLTPGSRIIYTDSESSRKVSVISVEPSPIFKNQMILKIKDGKIERGIPEKQWIERIIILDEGFKDIKKAIKVNSHKKLGIENNKLLKKIYSAVQLQQASFYPGDKYYLVGRLSQNLEDLSEKIFLYDGAVGSIGDFLYLDSSNSYTNGKLFSSQVKIDKIDINETVPVIFSNLRSYMKQEQNFKVNPKVVLSSRADNENRMHEVKEGLRIHTLQEKCDVVTHEIIKYLESTDTKIPNGIEFLAWRDQL